MPFDISDIFKVLFNMKDGVYLIGWFLSGYLLFRHFNNRDLYIKELDAARVKADDAVAKAKADADLKIQYIEAACDSKLVSLKDSYILEMKNMHESLQDLHAKNAQLFVDISNKRVEDIKEVVEEYNKMAEAILVTLDRLSASISKAK